MKLSPVLSVIAALALTPIAGMASAQPQRVGDKDLQRLAERLEEEANRFKNSLEDALDRSAINNTWEEEEIKRHVDHFEKAADRLDNRLDDRQASTLVVQEILHRAAVIDRFLVERPLGPGAEGDWRALRPRLDQLASAYGVSWRWRLGGVAATRTRRLSDDEMRRLIARIEEGADRFEDSLKDAIDDSVIDDIGAERHAEALLRSFDAATDRLRDRFDDDDQASEVVGRVLWDAERIDDFMLRHALGGEARSDWTRVRGDLRELARGYGVEPVMVSWARQD